MKAIANEETSVKSINDDVIEIEPKKIRLSEEEKKLKKREHNRIIYLRNKEKRKEKNQERSRQYYKNNKENISERRHYKYIQQKKETKETEQKLKLEYIFLLFLSYLSSFI